MTIQAGLDALFKDNADIFVAGDLLWYPIEGDNKIRMAPDVMVVFGRPKGDRGSYQQWREDNIPPQVVFEVLSPGNRLSDQDTRLIQEVGYLSSLSFTNVDQLVHFPTPKYQIHIHELGAKVP